MKKLLLLLLMLGSVYAVAQDPPANRYVYMPYFTPYQFPSAPQQAGLWVQVSPGVIIINNLPVKTPSARVGVTANTTTYIYVNLTAGTIQHNTTGFPAGVYPVATAAANATYVFTLLDARPDVFDGIATGGGSGITITTVSGLSSIVGATDGTIAAVTDGVSSTDCTVGGGSSTGTCQFNGTTWSSIGGGGSNVVFQTGGVNNANQTLLNLVAGAGITLVNSGGSVTITSGAGANPSVSFVNVLSASLATTFNTVNLTYQCWDANTPTNSIEGANAIINPSTFVVTFTFAALQSGYCVVNGSGGGGGGGGTGNAVIVNPAASQTIIQPAGSDFKSNSFNGVIYSVPSYNWSQTPSGTLSTNTLATVTLTPCPLGVDTSNNTIAPYGILISTVGTLEAVAVTGGTCTSGAASGTIVFTPGFSHGTGYTLGSANGGNQEAINVADGGNSAIAGGTQGFPQTVIQEVPARAQTANYLIYWPVYMNSGKMMMEGYGAMWQCFTRSACLLIGNYAGSTSGHQTISGLTLQPSINISGAQISSVSAASGVFTVNTASAHNLVPGDYAVIYYSTPARTQEARVQVVSTPSSTQFTYVLGSTVTFSSSSGFGSVSLEAAAIEDMSTGVKLVDIKLQQNGAVFRFNQGIIVGNDQLFTVDGLTNLSSSNVIHCDANACGNMIYFRTDAGSAPVGYIHHAELSMQCSGNGIRYAGGNTLDVQDSVIQGYSQYGIFYGGGLQDWQISNIYEEVGICTNPFYPGTLAAEAGLISNGSALRINGLSPITGSYPTFVGGGSVGSQRNYYVVVKDTILGTSKIMFIGIAKPVSGATSIPLYWPSPDLFGGGVKTYDILVTTGNSQTSAPYTGNAFSIVTGTSGSCNTSGICTYTDTQGATSAYTVLPGTYGVTFSFWPGDIVLGWTGGLNAALYADACPQSAMFISSNSMPSIFCNRGQTGGQVYSYSPYWAVYPSGDSSTSKVGAQLIPGAGTSSSASGITGAININYGERASVQPRELFTFMDGTPQQTLATPGYIRTASAADNFIGTDSTAAVGSQDQIYGSPVGHYFYVNNASFDTSSWLFGVNSTTATFNVPVNIKSNLSILGTCLQGCGPFIPGGVQVSDTFVRANGTLGANWTDQQGAWSISSNQAKFVAAVGDGRALTAYTASSPSANQFSSVTIANTASGCQGPAVRVANGAETGYIVSACSSSTVFLIKLVAGTATSLATYSGVTVLVGDVIRLEVNGTSLTVLKNGTALGSAVTDSAISSGFAGMSGSSASGGLINFAGGDLLYASKYITALSPTTFSTLAACTSTNEGSQAAVTDSSTNTWGDTITGSSTNHVMAYCDGSAWTVAGK